jgi:hypothetical protein
LLATAAAATSVTGFVEISPFGQHLWVLGAIIILKNRPKVPLIRPKCLHTTFCQNIYIFLEEFHCPKVFFYYTVPFLAPLCAKSRQYLAIFGRIVWSHCSGEQLALRRALQLLDILET